MRPYSLRTRAWPECFGNDSANIILQARNNKHGPRRTWRISSPSSP